jgi:hypothetical protein
MSKPQLPVYRTKSAVLFIIFNRPDTTHTVFEQIRVVKPPRLYIAADGPRADRPGEVALCEQAREIVDKIDWPCEAKSLFRDTNLGCKEAVSGAITWFFEQEEEGIILEDDCLPAISFFKFCDTLLIKYRLDQNIRHISGDNFQYGKKWGDASYYFSNLTHVWGWASWRRVWKDYDKELSRYTEEDAADKLSAIFADPLIVESWLHIFKELKAGKIDTWDFQLAFTNLFNNGLCIIPNDNLVSNIGFGEHATHTTIGNTPRANMPVIELGEIIHPENTIVQKEADMNTLKEEVSIPDKPNLFTKTINRWRKSISKRINKHK